MQHSTFQRILFLLVGLSLSAGLAGCHYESADCHAQPHACVEPGDGIGDNPPPGDDIGENPPASDTTPDAFSFTPVTGAIVGETYMAEVTITGINAETPVSITGGAYTIDGGGFGTADGTVADGQIVTVRVTASSEYETEVTAELTVGGVSATFSVTTGAALAVHFPPPRAATDISLPGTLRFRGRVASPAVVDTLTVGGGAVTVSADGSWTHDYAVAAGTQTVTVELVDTGGDTFSQDVFIQHFTDIDNGNGNFGSGHNMGNPKAVTIDHDHGDLVYTNTSGLDSVDPATTVRAQVFNGSVEFDANSTDVAFNATDGHLYVASYSVINDTGLGRVDRSDGSGTAISVRGDGEDDTDFNRPGALVLDEAREIAYMLVQRDADTSRYLWKVDLATGTRTRLASETYASSGDLAYDAANDRLLAVSCGIHQVDTDTGDRTELVSQADIGYCPVNLVVDPTGSRAFIRRAVSTVEFHLVDLDDLTVTALPGNGDPAFGPRIGFASAEYADVDWLRGIAYTIDDGNTNFGDRLTAIDLVTGYRVLVTLQH